MNEDIFVNMVAWAILGATLAVAMWVILGLTEICLEQIERFRLRRVMRRKLVSLDTLAQQQQGRDRP